ncbi:MAG: hypothetical protein II850_07235 [Fibrobacter sp.]|nr:hypothetical protein [Fibrobacter sp.]
MPTTVTTTIWMDEENIQKFIELYGEGDGKFSLSLIVPEPKEWTEEMFSGDYPDWHENTCMRTKWRTENWGTVTEAMGIQGEGLDLLEILSGQASFSTIDTPPAKVFEKMAADGLKFGTDFIKECCETGIGKVKNGKFEYHFDSDIEF